MNLRYSGWNSTLLAMGPDSPQVPVLKPRASRTTRRGGDGVKQIVKLPAWIEYAVSRISVLQ